MAHSSALNFWRVLVLVVLAGACRSSAPADQEASWLFVQSATSGTFDGETLTLEQVPAALLFSDRPERITGHMQTSHLLQAWDQGEDSLAADPPNAVLSTFGEGERPTLGTVVLSDPNLEGSTLTYSIEVLDGEVPERFGQASLFIDNWNSNDWERLGVGVAFGAARAGAAAAANSRPRINPPVAHSDSSYLTYYMKQGPPAASAPRPKAPPTRNQQLQAELNKLKQLRDEAAITEEEYVRRRQAILDQM